jgi:hypothetical protein
MSDSCVYFSIASSKVGWERESYVLSMGKPNTRYRGEVKSTGMDMKFPDFKIWFNNLLCYHV